MKKFKLLLAAVAAFIFIIPLAVSPAFANSGLYWEYGVTPSGCIIRNENSVLQVESEKLTFDINDFPSSSMAEYKSSFKAEYTFVNPTGDTVHTTMAFPSGMLPGYNIGELDITPDIRVDGVKVQAQVRHTCGVYSRDFREQIKKLDDGWYQDDFYNPDLPVTEYELKVKDAKDSQVLKCCAKMTADKSKTRYMVDAIPNGDILDIHLYDRNSYKTVYVLGEDNLTSLNWTVFGLVGSNSSDMYVKTDLTAEFTKVGQTTLKELALKGAPEESKVSEQDRYNAIVHGLRDERITGYANYFLEESDFLTWYVYDVVVAPHGRIVNSVSAPILPAVYSYKTDYEYSYYLSPAAEWDSFGELEVVINTEHEMRDFAGFERFDGGYKATFATLPDTELRFVLSGPRTDLEMPNSAGASLRSFLIAVLVILAVIFVAGITVAIVVPLAIHAKHKKMAQN